MPLPWTRFEWVGADIGTQHVARAALFVPITLKGIDGVYYLQHDLGSDQTMFYEVPLRQVLARAGRTNTLKAAAVIDGRIAGVDLRNFRIGLRLKFGDPLTPDDKFPVIGTLGLDFFEKRGLLLDYPAQRLAIVPSDFAWPADLTNGASFVPLNLRNGKLFLPLTLNGKNYPDDFFFDTGASLLPVVTTRSLWQEITGRAGNEPDNRTISGQSWDNKVRLVGAPIRGRARIGTVSLEQPLAYFDATANEDLDFDKWPYKVKGTIGNAFFYDAFLVIIDLPHKHFGVVRSSLGGAK